MALFPSLPDEASLADVFQTFPQHIGPLMRYLDDVLRGDGALSVGERELVAAYVSGRNACTYCVGTHVLYAKVFGVGEEVLEACLGDLGSAPVSPQMRAILTYVGKLNTLPSRLVQADADAVWAAGVTEAMLIEAIHVAGAFNLMNRLVEGTGVTFDPLGAPEKHSTATGGAAAQEHSYLNVGRRMGVLPPDDPKP